jgi:serine/threonine protein phosphatase PrpC
MQGWRVDMEDAHTTEPRLTIEGNLFPSWSFFAIFDGHAGSCAAKMSSTRLIKTILKQDEFKVTSYRYTSGHLSNYLFRI